ncbi:MAG: type II toxin-antitoxin system RelE/ParE family toxin [Lachnospiraceae bacterium]|nr:type II toxin-antitoxin system RelE/ParE family toxin [Lachnospiraceae bacterium]
MTKYRLTLTQKAKDDIVDIGTYITETLLSPDTSKRFIKGLRKSISELKFFPYKFPLVQDDFLQNQGIRCIPYKNYYVFYKIIEQSYTVVVLRVGYNKRNWKSILS